MHIVTTILVFAGLCLSWTGAHAAPLTINIDNPSFRKLVVAVPEFYVESSDRETEQLAEDSRKELERLLTFSGLFNVLSQAAFNDLRKTISPKDYMAQDKGAIDMPAWRKTSAESLTLSAVTKDSSGFTFTMRTIDLSRGEVLIGKKFSKVPRSQWQQVIRRYADLMLEAYTGRPGIFRSKLVFVGRQSAKASKHIYLSDFDGSNVIQVTKDSSPHLSPSWSRDGKFITYTSFEDGNPDIFIYELATGKKRKLTTDKSLDSGANWSANDRLIAYTGELAGDTDIYVVPPTGGKRKLVISGNGLDVDATFSPNNKWMAFVSGRFGNPHIFLATLEWSGEDSVRVTGDKRLTYAGWYNATPSWSPDSDRIAFAGYDKEINRFDLFMMNPDGTKLERLTLRSGYNERPSFSPNGQNIVFQSDRTGGRDERSVFQLYVMNRDGSMQRPLTTGLYMAETPQWGPSPKDD